MKKLLSNEDGLELVEYGVLTALIVVAMVLSITGLVDSIESMFDRLVNLLP